MVWGKDEEVCFWRVIVVGFVRENIYLKKIKKRESHWGSWVERTNLCCEFVSFVLDRILVLFNIDSDKILHVTQFMLIYMMGYHLCSLQSKN